MKYTLISCSLTIILTVTIIPCLTSSLREIDFLSTLFKKIRDDSILPTKVFTEVLRRRVDKINYFKERNNLTSEELVFCDFARHSLRSMQILLNSSSDFVRIKSNLVKSYHDIVASFHAVFDNKRTFSVDYEPVLQINTRKIGNELMRYCDCYPAEEETPSAKAVYPKLKILMLIDDYKSDFNLYADYARERKQYLSSFIDALETLKWQISNATSLINDLDEYDREKLNPETMKVSWARFEFIVKMFLKQIANS
ncbi:uncharacterized protein LOC107361008 [Tetranychus urticae]|uniref:Uncharacterized protein n=1 Tax=Tetranychus urticae TaxID=32264 RepID=T1K6X1_TETUR|nr:uncharacterized protein LOC107361008 [Tetranychus urticae]